MNDLNSNSRLSRIETMWSIVRRAHDSADMNQVESAQQELLGLYGSAIRRYLLAAVKDADLADDLFQEFAVKFVNGDFRSADPDRGRFRSFVKTILSRMIALHFRKQKTRKEKPLQNDLENESELDLPGDEVFTVSWREELLSRTWSALQEHEKSSGQKYDTVLRIKVAEPTLSSEMLAAKISDAIGKPTSAGSARVLVHRSREKFAHLMIDVVANSLENGNRENVEAELIDLGLIDYCRDALDQLPSSEGGQTK